VVLVGDTDTEVPVTVPTPGPIDSDVAPVTLHDRVAPCPDWMDDGLDVNVWIDGGERVMVTVTVAVLLPNELVAVRV
jgi:hypothetical protein